MGGNGASSGFSVNKNKYGSQYKAIFTHGNIKFVVKSKKNTEPLLETMTKGRVYVEINKSGNVKTIYYFDNDLKKRKTIDLLHKHRKMQPHAHHGYYHSENDGPKGGTNLTPQEKKMVDTVLNAWYNYKRNK
ncbi:MAG: hypothetical protein IJS17_05580 [Clostridia bacterium]|nr:hypothetical protein [Clostridia bacterium]